MYMNNSTNLVVIGIEHGDCVCDSCKCKNSYYGDYCQCPPKENCLGDNGVRLYTFSCYVSFLEHLRWVKFKIQ